MLLSVEEGEERSRDVNLMPVQQPRRNRKLYLTREGKERFEVS